MQMKLEPMYTTNYHEFKSFDFDSVFIVINKFIPI